MRVTTTVLGSALLAAACLAVAPPAARAEEEPVVEPGKGSARLRALPRRAGPKPVVAVYEFRSTVPGVQVAGALDMFVTALVKSGAFAVVERQRLTEGVLREKQLNAGGYTTGNAGPARLAGAGYVLEAVLSEANAGERQGQGGFSLGGLQVARSTAADSIGLDVRVVDASSGAVVDAVNVRKVVEASESEVKGVGQAAQNVGSLFGMKKPIPLNPDVATRSSRKEGVDAAVRACIEAAVHELARRFGEE